MRKNEIGTTKLGDSDPDFYPIEGFERLSGSGIPLEVRQELRSQDLDPWGASVFVPIDETVSSEKIDASFNKTVASKRRKMLTPDVLARYQYTALKIQGKPETILRKASTYVDLGGVFKPVTPVDTMATAQSVADRIAKGHLPEVSDETAYTVAMVQKGPDRNRIVQRSQDVGDGPKFS